MHVEPSRSDRVPQNDHLRVQKVMKQRQAGREDPNVRQGLLHYSREMLQK